MNLQVNFKAHFFISLLIGFIVAFPYLVFELWRFIKPALKIKEAKYGRATIFWVSILFSIGMIFGYFLILPITVSFLENYIASSQIENTINCNYYFSTLTSLTVGAGLIFELPVVAFFLAKIGILKYTFVKKYRKHAIVLFFVAAAAITPSPDAFSITVLALPIWLLYEISTSIVKRVSAQRILEL